MSPTLATFCAPKKEHDILSLSLLTVPSSKLINRIKLKTWENGNTNVLLNSFPMNGHTLGFCTWSQKLENFVSAKISLWESKG